MKITTPKIEARRVWYQIKKNQFHEPPLCPANKAVSPHGQRWFPFSEFVLWRGEGDLARGDESEDPFALEEKKAAVNRGATHSLSQKRVVMP